MSTSEAGLPREHPGRRRALVGLAFAVALAVYVGVRHGSTSVWPATFTGACQRLRDSGLTLTSKDWFCQQAPWTRTAANLAGNALIWLTFVVPCAILAATGRRFTALLPMLSAPFFTISFIDIRVRWWGTDYWPVNRGAAVALNMLCIALPVAAVGWASRSRLSRPGTDPTTVSVFVSGAVLLLPTYLSLVVARHLFTGVDLQEGPTWVAMLPIVVFAALLGPNRKWWPWSIAPVAVLLSFGPTVAVIWAPSSFDIWTLFGHVLPLALVGLTWTAWWPLSVWLTARVRARRAAVPDPERTLAVPIETVDSAQVPAPAPAADPARRAPLVRPGVVLNSLAIVLVAVSMIAFRADPSGAELGTSLPTFLGVRANWQDVRARMDLRQGMAAMDRYAAQHGSYLGTDAAIGVTLDPSLAWTDLSALSGHTDGRVNALVMVVPAHGALMRIGALSASGTAFCVGRAGPNAPLTYSAATMPPTGRSTERDRLRAALATCGDAPWSASLLNTVPVGSLCDGRNGPDEGYIMCRVVQALGVGILSHAKPQ